MKILVILTGGTIGSLISDNVINVKEGASLKLIEMYQEREGNDIEFEVIQPLNILSENLDPSHWESLCDCLDRTEPAAEKETAYDAYDMASVGLSAEP